MVRGTTRQVIVVRGSNDASFDQAFFLVKDEIVSGGGVSEDALLKEARQACQRASHPGYIKNMLWSLSGSALMGFIWLLTAILQ